MTASLRTPTAGAPPGFPASVRLYRQTFRNWSGEICADSRWTCAPASPQDVVTLANWAHAHGWRLRPRGRAHSWAPLVVPPGEPDTVVLVDTTQHLTTVRVNPSHPVTVTAGVGLTMEALLTTLEAAGYGLAAVPAPGDLSLGGVLAVDAHGTGVPAAGEHPAGGHTFGSVSNLVVSLTAVVWDPARHAYTLRTFDRSEPEAGALLVSLGRAFLTEVTLRVGVDHRLRCLSRCDLAVGEVFAPPATAGPGSFASWVERTGRVEAVWYPFTATPWLKLWSVAPERPWPSRQVTGPYNYPFTEAPTREYADLLSRILAGAGPVTPAFCNAQLAAVVHGLGASGSWDLWGRSKNVLLYARPSAPRVTANGYAVLTSRSQIQRVVSEFHAHLVTVLTAFQEQGRYPVNGPLNVRVTGLDRPGDIGVPRAAEPLLSAARSRPDHPEWDVAVWLDVLTAPGTPDADEFYADLEGWILGHFTGGRAAVRPEWSKGWGYTGAGAWTDPAMLTTTVPDAYRAGQPAGADWDAARRTFDALDPHQVFSSRFLDSLLR